MSRHCHRLPSIAIVGGDSHRFDLRRGDANLSFFSSSKYGGNGRLQSTLASIRRGSFDLVILMVRWLGHPESHALVAACRACQAPVRTVPGGISSVANLVDEFVAKVVALGR